MNRCERLKGVRAKLDQGKVTIGTWMQFSDPDVAEIIAAGGYDWVCIDLEHGCVSESDYRGLARAIAYGGSLPLARMRSSSHDFASIKTVLDNGFGGIVVPDVRCLDQVVNIGNLARWSPAGTRGVGFSYSNKFGADFDQYAEEAQSPLIVVMVEHVDMIDALFGISELDFVDAIFVGPYDLSASLGIKGQFEHPEFVKALDRLKSACQGKIPMGIHVVDPCSEELQRRIDEGFRFIAYGIDAVFLRKFAPAPRKIIDVN